MKKSDPNANTKTNHPLSAIPLGMHVSRGLELKDTTVQPTEQILFKVIRVQGFQKKIQKSSSTSTMKIKI